MHRDQQVDWFDVADLEYALPEELIAQAPAARREDARLLVIHRSSGALADRRMVELPELLAPGDLLVLNDTKVLPAKFLARRATGGRVKGLFLESTLDQWEVLLEPSGRLRPGEFLRAEKVRGAETAHVDLELLELVGAGRWRLRVHDSRPAEQILESIGTTPLPPYIQRKSAAEEVTDRGRYQTVYARRPGAVAAPTAGLHLTAELLERIQQRGVHTAFVTLHVGVGTFKPITAERIGDHVMHSERFELSEETAEAINACRGRGGRVAAVGTTTVRVLETVGRIVGSRSSNVGWAMNREPKEKAGKSEKPGSRENEIGCSTDGVQSSSEGKEPTCGRRTNIDNPSLSACRGSTDVFIYPPYEFRVVDSLLTNFHLPRSTLLAMVMAFAGVELTRRAYQHAILQGYRFYSYGDAMWIT